MLPVLLAPEANRVMLQKPRTTQQACQKQRAEHSQIPAPPGSSSPANVTADRSKPSVGGERSVQNTAVDSPLVPAATGDANKQPSTTAKGRRKVVIADDMQHAKPSCGPPRKVSPSDSGIALSPRGSPAQHSPSTAITTTNAQPSSTPTEQSQPGEQRQKRAPFSNGIKRSDDNTAVAGLPPAPTGQKQTFQPPCSTSNLEASGMTASLSHESSSSLPTTVATYIPMQPSTPNTPTNILRTSHYPIPMARSPLVDNAILIGQDDTYEDEQTSSGSISTGSSSSSLQRLFQRVSQKPTPTRNRTRDGRPLQGVLNPTLESVDELDQWSSLPYESLPVAGPTPTFVDQPITPRVVRNATFPVTALPVSSDYTSPEVRHPKGKRPKQNGSSLLGSLFLRNANKSRRRNHAETSRQQTPNFNDFPVHPDLATPNYKSCSHCGSPATLQATSSSPPATRPQQLRSEAPSPLYQDHYATKPLPLPPVPPRERRDANEWPRIDVPQATRDDERDRDPITTQRHRRRALFALDGLTFSAGTNTRDFNAFVGRQEVALPPSSPPLNSPIRERAVLDEMEESNGQTSLEMQPSASGKTPAGKGLQIGRTQMSDEAKRLFIRKGKEAEARVFSAHDCAEPSLRAAVTGDGFAISSEDLMAGGPWRANKDLQTAIIEKVPEPESEAVPETEPTLVKKDVAWWEEEAQDQPTGQVKVAKRSRSGDSIDNRKATPGEDLQTREATLDNAMQNLEMTARTSRLRPNLRTAFEVVEAENITNTHVSGAPSLITDDETPAQVKGLSITTRRPPPPPPPPTPVETNDHVSASSTESQQAFSSEEKQSRERGRQLARDTFRRHREAGRWDLVVQTHPMIDAMVREQTQTTVRITQTHQDVSPISDASNRPIASTDLEHNAISPVTSSNSSSSASLNATVFRSQRSTGGRKGKAKQPPLDPTEAAIAVQKTPDADLTPTSSTQGSDSQGNGSPESELRRKMRPEPLSVRHRSQGEGRRREAAREGLGLGIDAAASKHVRAEEPSASRNGAATGPRSKTQLSRPPPPPSPPSPSSTAPVRSASGSGYIPLPFTPVSPGAALQKVKENGQQRRSPPHPSPPPPPPATPQQRKQPSTPPIPPRSELRPRLGGDWSGMSLQELKRSLMAGGGKGRRNLESVAEDAKGLLGDGVMEEGSKDVGKANAKGVAWSDADDDDNESVYSVHDEGRFWSDDEGASAAGGESSKKTTPEKDEVWVPPPSLPSLKRKKNNNSNGASTDDGAKRGVGGDVVDDENQLLDYYLNAQRDEAEHGVRDAEEAKRQAEGRAAAEAEVERRGENEARARRVANLLAKIRE